MFKVTLVLLVVLVAIQANYIHHKGRDFKKPGNVENIDDIIEEIKELLEKLKQDVDNTVQKVKTDLEQLEKLIDAVAEKVISQTKEEIEKDFDKLLEKLEKLVEDADNEVASTCLAKYEPQLKTLPDELVDELVSCVTKKVEEGKAIIEGVWKDIDEVYQEIANLEEEIDNCGTGLEAAACLTRLVADVTEDVVALPAKLTLALTNAQEYVATLLPRLEACGIGKVGQLNIEGGKILIEIGLCIEGL